MTEFERLQGKVEEVTLAVNTFMAAKAGEDAEIDRRLTRLEDDSIEYGKGFEKLNNFLHKTQFHMQRLQEDISDSDLVRETLEIAANFKMVKDSVAIAREYLDEFIAQIRPKA